MSSGYTYGTRVFWNQNENNNDPEQHAEKLDVCLFYMRGYCSYGDCCIKYHPPNSQLHNDEPNAKINKYNMTGMDSNQNGGHEPNAEPRAKNMKGNEFNQNRPRVVCIHYQRGTCSYGDACFKSHINPQPKNTTAYPNSATYSKSTNYPNIPAKPKSTVLPKPACWISEQDLDNGLSQSRSISSDPLTKFVKKPGCDRPDPINTYRKELEMNKVVCVHYKMGKCAYGDGCRKQHSDPTKNLLKVVLPQTQCKPEPSKSQTEPTPKPESAEAVGRRKKKKGKNGNSAKVEPKCEPSTNIKQEQVMSGAQDNDANLAEVESIEYVTEVIEEERKLTKKERKRQDALLQKFAKKQAKKSETDDRVKSQMSEAFQFLKEKNIGSSFQIFQNILSLPNHQTKAWRQEALLGRSRCHRARQDFALALSDINEAVKDVTPSLKFTNITIADFYLQVAELKIISGEIQDARAALENVPGGCPDFEDRVIYLEQCIANAEVTMGDAYFMKHVTPQLVYAKWHEAMAEIYLASDIAPECPKVKLLKAEILVHLQRFTEAKSILSGLSEITLNETFKSNLRCVQSILEYFNIDWKEFPQYFSTHSGFNRVCNNFADLGKKKHRWKTFHNKLITIQEMVRKKSIYITSNLVDIYSNSINLDLTNKGLTSRLHFLLAMALTGMPSDVKTKSSMELKTIFDHFETSLNLEMSHETLYERAKLFAVTEEYDQALQDLKKAAPMAPWNIKIRKMINKVTEIQNRKKQAADHVGHYEVLGVDHSASSEEIRRAFKLKAKEFHPDRHSGVAESKKTELETKMKAVNRAYKVLTDTYSRRSYDAGLYNKSNFADYFDSDTSSSNDDYEEQSDDDDYEDCSDEDDEPELDFMDFLHLFRAFSGFR